MLINHIRRKFRSQTSDNMDRWKAEMGRVREGQRREEKRRRKNIKKEKFLAERRSRRMQSHLARWEMKSCTPFWRKVHTFPSPNVQNTMLGPLLAVEMSKKCTPLRREAHFEVKSVKNWRSRTTVRSWDVEKVYYGLARSTFRSQKWKKLMGLEHSWTFGCRFAWQAQGILHLAKSEQNVRVLWQFQLQPLHYTTPPLHYNYNYNYNCTTLHYTTLHYTPLHFTTFHYTSTTTTTTITTTTTLHYTTLITLHYANYITLRYSTLHKLQLQLQLQLRYFTLH